MFSIEAIHSGTLISRKKTLITRKIKRNLVLHTSLELWVYTTVHNKLVVTGNPIEYWAKIFNSSLNLVISGTVRNDSGPVCSERFCLWKLECPLKTQNLLKQHAFNDSDANHASCFLKSKLQHILFVFFTYIIISIISRIQSCLTQVVPSLEC